MPSHFPAPGRFDSVVCTGIIVQKENALIAENQNVIHAIASGKGMTLFVETDLEMTKIVAEIVLIVEIGNDPIKVCGIEKMGKIGAIETEVGVMTGNGSGRKGGSISRVSMVKKGRKNN